MSDPIKFGVRVRALMAAQSLDRLAASVEDRNSLEAQVHRKSAEIIRLLAEYAPVNRPPLKVVK